MKDFNLIFGMIRSLLMKPSTQSWKQLSGHLDRYESRWYDPVIQERLVHYTKCALERWPKNIPRYAQHLWITRAIKGEEVPQLQFTTALQFVSQNATEEDIALLFNNLNLENVRSLDFRSAIVGQVGVEALLEYPFVHLEYIDARNAAVTKTMANQLRDKFKATNCEVLA